MENQTPESPTPHTATVNVESLGTPIAIVIAGALVAAALFFGGTGGTANRPATVERPTTPDTFVAVSASDHIMGNPDAPIKIIEYTDLECPFCKQFHGTMHTIMDTYGATGQVAWVIRNFPLEQLHPNAPKLAEAAECVAEVGGNTAYWAFLDEIIKVAPINTFFDMSKLNAAVTAVGVNVASFRTCYDSGKYADKVAGEVQDAFASGGNGTPHNILVDKKGKATLIPGSQPLDVVKKAIEAAL